MPTEIRYFCSDMHTVNNVTAKKLSTIPSGTYLKLSHSEESGVEPDSARCGVRIYKLAEGATRTEITSGVSAVAYVDYGAGKQVVSKTWTCVDTPLNPTDAILIEVYLDPWSFGWVRVGTFITEQLGASKLELAIWTFYYELWATYSDMTAEVSFYIGETSNSRIEDFTYAPAPGKIPTTLTLEITPLKS